MQRGVNFRDTVDETESGDIFSGFLIVSSRLGKAEQNLLHMCVCYLDYLIVQQLNLIKHNLNLLYLTLAHVFTAMEFYFLMNLIKVCSDRRHICLGVAPKTH